MLGSLRDVDGEMTDLYQQQSTLAVLGWFMGL
jgi:hypothetical protein